MHRSALVAVALALVIAVTPAWARDLGDKFAQESARGDFAIAQAGGNVNNVDSLYVKVQSSPRQKVSGAYTVVCSRDGGAGSKSGHVRGNTTLKQQLNMPYDQADSCSASANAQLADGGKVTVKLFVKH